MTNIAELLTPERVACGQTLTSKKRALEQLAGLLSPGVARMTPTEIFESLNARERLGSTGLGHGIALPHGRVERVTQPTAACLTLARPIDYQAPDNQAVDILFGLLLPRECNEQHLQILADLAALFHAAELRDTLRAQTDPGALVACFDKAEPPVNQAHGTG